MERNSESFKCLLPSPRWKVRKITQSERVIHSSVGGMKVNLSLQAEMVIREILKSISQNARGKFRLKLSFLPDARLRSGGGK